MLLYVGPGNPLATPGKLSSSCRSYWLLPNCKTWLLLATKKTSKKFFCFLLLSASCTHNQGFFSLDLSRFEFSPHLPATVVPPNSIPWLYGKEDCVFQLEFWLFQIMPILPCSSVWSLFKKLKKNKKGKKFTPCYPYSNCPSEFACFCSFSKSLQFTVCVCVCICMFVRVHNCHLICRYIRWRSLFNHTMTGSPS